jgi:hypothetical protein
MAIVRKEEATMSIRSFESAGLSDGERALDRPIDAVGSFGPHTQALALAAFLHFSTLASRYEPHSH